MKNIIIGLACTFLLPCTGHGIVHRQEIHDNWQFRQARQGAWHPASVPGVVHTDLMACGLIRDPFIGLNEREVQWVDKEDWIYTTSFDLDSMTNGRRNVNLVFDGLDTYADVYLNDSLLLKVDNMFRRWRLPVASLLREKGNELKIMFHSPIKVDMPKHDALPFRYEAVNDQSANGGVMNKRLSVFARKAGYHYGWDWGPRLVTSGIWRPVYLESWDDTRINDVFIDTKSISKAKASLSASIKVTSDRDMPDCDISISEGKRIVAHKHVSLTKGDNIIDMPFEIRNPRLWWCNGMGEPAMYDLNTVVTHDGKELDSKRVSTGIRHIEVVRDIDSEGRSFYFRLNGVPVFAKGANYIPCDNFLPRVTREIYEKTVRDAADANMNMLRVWGGGIYEDDMFYELCDRNGIMVWQDFMFACSLYPSEGQLLENIRQEAIDNVCRLRNHPCIALWCGNNECLEAWYTWGWKERYGRQGVGDKVWNQYDTLYHKVLPAITAQYAPSTFYWPSSPFSREDGASEANMGDSHLWRVWGGEPIELYNTIRSRFFSEYGFQSFPEIETIMKYAPDTAEHDINSETMLAHQRGGADANNRICKYLLESYPQPKDFKSLIYMTHILQGDAVKTAIEAHRRDRPYCMGSLFWQHNDCWPVASWSSRDYYGRWKAQHYFAKKAYRDILVSPVVKGDTLNVYVVSDRTSPVSGHLEIKAFSIDGQTIGNIGKKMSVPAGSVRSISLKTNELTGDIDPSEVILAVSFTDKSGKRYDNLSPLVKPKDMRLKSPEIRMDVKTSDGGCTVTVSSDTFARGVKLMLKGDDTHFFDDNYFDLVPGIPHTVSLTTTLPVDKVRQNLSSISLYSATH